MVKKPVVKKAEEFSPEAKRLAVLADRAGVDPATYCNFKWMLKLGGYKIKPTEKTIRDAVKYDRQWAAQLRTRVVALGGEWR
jgi:hypothetical protein